MVSCMTQQMVLSVSMVIVSATFDCMQLDDAVRKRYLEQDFLELL